MHKLLLAMILFSAPCSAQLEVARGGGFNDPGYDIRITSRKLYSQPSIDIGFRIVMQVLK